MKKALFSAACVVTCCLGNANPANAEGISARLSKTLSKLPEDERLAFQAGYQIGYAYGGLVDACAHYTLGVLPRRGLEATAGAAAQEGENVRALILDWFRSVDDKSSRKCLPVIEKEFNAQGI